MSSKPGRIEALDVLRGLTVALMIMVNNAGDSYHFMHHCDWNGMTPCDMVFPFFLFIMGASCYLSLCKGGFNADSATLLRIGKRTVMIILVCWAIFWFSRIVKGDFLPFDHFRLTGVLVRIAITYGLLSVLAVTVNHRFFPWIALALLAAYSVILVLGNGYCNDASNIIARVDAAVLGKSHLYTRRPIDPEGLLGLIPSLAHGIIGFMCGKLLRENMDLVAKMKRMALTGAGLIAAGMVLSIWLPLNKRIWSPSFVLVTCGSAELLLSILIYLIDFRGQSTAVGERLKTFCKAFGMNALAIYVLSEVLEIVFGVTGFTKMCHTGLRAVIPGMELADLLYCFLFMMLNYMVARLLYKYKIVIKL